MPVGDFAAVGHVQRPDFYPAHHCADRARLHALILVGVFGKAGLVWEVPEDFGGFVPGDNRDAVPLVQPVRDDVVASLSERFGGEFVVFDLGFLQAQHVDVVAL